MKFSQIRSDISVVFSFYYTKPSHTRFPCYHYAFIRIALGEKVIDIDEKKKTINSNLSSLTLHLCLYLSYPYVKR